MKRIHIIFIGLILLEILLLFMGCHGDKLNPLVPGTNPDSITTDSLADPVARSVASTPALWGYYSVSYDPASRTMQAIPLRSPAFALNVVQFLQPPAGSQLNLGIQILDDSSIGDNGRIDVRIILHHPFPGQMVYTGFDVCGVFITEGSQSAPGNPSLTFADPTLDPNLLNPDGYTRWMNPEEFPTGDIFGYEPGFWGTSESSENSGFVAGATLNPYKYFAIGLGPNDDLESWLEDPSHIADRGMFPAGATCSRDYELVFPIIGSFPNFKFNYAVLANWEPPINQPVNDPVSDFPHEANARYPLHIFVEDNSQVYCTPGIAGGSLSFEITVFDWDALLNPLGIPGEVTGFTFWSNESLVPGGSMEFLTTDVEWNSGFIASTSVANIEILDAVPTSDGEKELWIAIGSTDPAYYDQGLGATVPDDPLASYFMVPVMVASCPKAFTTSVGSGKAGSGDYLDDVEITGDNFIDGDDLGIRLLLADAGGSAGEPGDFLIEATDLKYIDQNTITADFDLTGAPLGEYGIGCTNGCGAITTPEENNAEKDDDPNLKVLPQGPFDIELSTLRSYSTPTPLDKLRVSWSPVEDTQYYELHVKCFDLSGTVIAMNIPITCNSESYDLYLNTLPLMGGGMLELWVNAFVLSTSDTEESMPSRSGYMIFQGFESGMGQWALRSESELQLKFARSAVDAGWSSVWGIKSYGLISYYSSLWTVLATPPIPDYDETSVVRFEFLHRYMNIAPTNGYQVGWSSELPINHQPTVENFTPVIETLYGHAYSDSDCTALQDEFYVSPSEDNNYSHEGTYYMGWYLSGFDVSEILGDDVPNYIMIAFAGNYYNAPDICIDDVAILIY